MERDGIKRTVWIVGVVLSIGAAGPQVAPPPLSGLPGAPGPHVAQIQAMANNSWLQLSQPAADPAYGRCMGRSWGARAAYSPALRAGFYYGEGGHGWWDSATRRYMDDLWAYDIMANRWICLYPGANVDTLSLTLNADGFEVDSTGQPIPVAQNVHGYEMLAFDTDRQKFAWMSCPGGYDSVLDARRKSWGARAGYRPSSCSPWMYDVATGKFQLQKTPAGAPSSGFGDTLLYVPGLKKFWFKRGGQPDPDVWYYDPAANTWTGVRAPGPKPPFGIDSTACLDTKRNRIYIGGGSYPVASGPNALWIFDLNTNTWIDPQPQGSPGNSYATAYAFMNYDSVDDVVLLVKHSVNPKGVFVYDPKTNAWTQAAATIPGLSSVNAFYDPSLNVIFAHNAGDNREGQMWVYRYGSTPAADTIPPTISITAPSSGSASASPAAVSGTASDDVAVTQVTWSNGATGAGGTATGTTSWSASIPLVAGTNVITIRAHDAAGNVGTATVTLIGPVSGGGGGTSPPPPGPRDGKNGDGSINDTLCGALGCEALLVLGVLAFRRWR